ncbi:MAG: DUF1571 domain-containing protein [Bacteroidota bacterium]|nr:DUF1571 domain-containing protein [Bacteroidota bacterium]MDP3144092.1 DUF1571 domain-containing protein [Bacteroidota bacterium]MDP3558185.1 DUF1571 domain-containing protein [Bacteroidota bacterium]
MNIKLIISLFSALLIGFSFRTPIDIKPAMILHQMYDSIQNIKTLRVKVSSVERLEENFSSANSEYKVQTRPRKLYFRNPDKKLEVLFNTELYGRKALVKPHVFPYFTISLDPTGNIMRKNQHYSINELGYTFIGNSIALTISKDKNGLNNFTYLGKANKNGYSCYFLQYENKNYAYIDYVVCEKETATSIAYKLNVNDYLLRHKNDLLNDFGYLKKGTTLKVPTLYCKKANLFIDDHLMVPISLSLYDDKGLFESYDFSNVQINKPFLEDEFNRDNKNYGF